MNVVALSASPGKSSVWEEKPSTELLDTFMTFTQMKLSEMMRIRMDSASF